MNTRLGGSNVRTGALRLFALAAALQGAAFAGEMERATPESQGVDSRAILAWLDACDQKLQYMHGFVIVRHGKVIAEGTWAPFDTLRRPHMLYSHSKSFTSTAIGFLADDGKLDIDERISDIFADKMPSNPPPWLMEVRVRDLLTMNFGSDANKPPKCNLDQKDWERGILSRPMETRPGTRHRYDSDATYLLACIVERKSGKRVMEFLKERLFDPLGMESPWSTVSPSGTACGGWGMNMTTRDLAKFGQFLLNGGTWNGNRVMSSDWIRLASSKHTNSNGGPDWRMGYGFQFWRCQHNAYRADGAAGQYTVVMEDQDAVVSINAAIGDMQKELDLVWAHLLPAFGNEPLPENAEAQKALANRIASLAIAPMPRGAEGVGANLPAKVTINRNDLRIGGEGTLERTEKGWALVSGGRRLEIGDGAWAETTWKFDDGNIEPAFLLIGTRTAVASGAWKDAKTFKVTWHLLGAIQNGSFEVKVQGD